MTLPLLIIIITAIVSFSAFGNRTLMEKLLFSPYEIKRKKQWYRFITYGFVHADFIHLFINMWVLYIFGDTIVQVFSYLFGDSGIIYFIMLYIGGLAFSTLYSYGRHHANYSYSAVGASGAVSSIVFAFIILFPAEKLMIFPLPIPLPAWIFGLLYLGYSWFMARRGKDNIGHDAHFFGALYGLLFILLIRPESYSHFIRSITLSW